VARWIVTRDFSIDDYDATLQLWQRVEGLEVAEGDDKEGVARFVARNPGLSRVAIDGSKVVGVAMCGHDGRRGHIYHVAVDPAIADTDLVSVWCRNAWTDYDGLASCALLSWWPTTISAVLNSGSALAGRIFPARCRWELMFRSTIVSVILSEAKNLGSNWTDPPAKETEMFRFAQHDSAIMH
jgi:hypothetical protein